MIPPQPALRPAWIALNEVAQRITGFADLPDGFDLMDAIAAGLAPPLPVVPHLAALHLDADNARTFDGDHEVDLVILEVIGDPLAGDQKVARFELVDQRLPNQLLGAVGQPWGFRWDDCHAFKPPPRSAVATTF